MLLHSLLAMRCEILHGHRGVWHCASTKRIFTCLLMHRHSCSASWLKIFNRTGTSESMRDFFALKGPLKYLVAKLHGCYPGANSLPVSQNFFARFFRRRPVVDSSRCLTFLLRCNKQKNTFCLLFFINVLLYGYNMWVVPLFFKLSCFAWKLHPRTAY